MKLTGLILDEIGVKKKRDKSVVVRHQYCGNVGKQANSQVAVMRCLSNRGFASMVDDRLYLPKDLVFKTKIDLAYEMIIHQLELGTSFDYVGADGFYGNDFNLARKVDLLGLTYMFDIHSNQPVYLKELELVLPERKGERGPKPQQLTIKEQNINISEYVKDLDQND